VLGKDNPISVLLVNTTVLAWHVGAKGWLHIEAKVGTWDHLIYILLNMNFDKSII